MNSINPIFARVFPEMPSHFENYFNYCEKKLVNSNEVTNKKTVQYILCLCHKFPVHFFLLQLKPLDFSTLDIIKFIAFNELSLLFRKRVIKKLIATGNEINAIIPTNPLPKSKKFELLALSFVILASSLPSTALIFSHYIIPDTDSSIEHNVTLSLALITLSLLTELLIIAFCCGSHSIITTIQSENRRLIHNQNQNQNQNNAYFGEIA